MTAYDIYENLLEAYETSTMNANRFLKAINKIAWDQTFEADGEFYFLKDRFTLMTPSLDPFHMEWRPSVLFGDGSYISV